ncbi:aspartic peptidase domain-containing protein [Lipomyces orientalis]|uniref:Aspartic peptidase domain-containing protein n=1 Tax=Lipomyces orientalis TaxID=1233043 RepID=A0ACC3TMP9_9ASCO
MGLSFPLTQRLATHLDHPHMVVRQHLPQLGAQYLTDQHQFVKTYSEHKPKLGTDSVNVSHHSAIYTVSVGVGTPPQMQSLLIDTGSSDLVVFSSASKQCRESSWGCGGGYNPLASSTYEKLGMPFVVGFGNQSNTARGSFVRDDVLLGEFLIRKQQLAMVEDSILDFDIEGVLGLGYKSMQQTEEKYGPIASQIYSNDLRRKPVYSLYLDSRHRKDPLRPRSENALKSAFINMLEYPSTQSDPQVLPQASLDLGIIDTSKHVGDQMSFIPCTSEHGFSVRLNDISFRGSSGLTVSKSFSVLDRQAHGELDVLLDSGTIGILLIDDIADAMARRISPLTIYDDSLPGYRLPCSAIPTSGDSYFEFTFSADFATTSSSTKTVKVAFSELYRELSTASNTPGDKMCMLDIVRESTYSIGNILGTAFLSSVYAVFDVEEHRVGIAQATYYM